MHVNMAVATVQYLLSHVNPSSFHALLFNASLFVDREAPGITEQSNLYKDAGIVFTYLASDDDPAIVVLFRYGPQTSNACHHPDLSRRRHITASRHH